MIQVSKSFLGVVLSLFVGMSVQAQTSAFCPNAVSIETAKTAPLLYFDRALAGGAHTWVFNGSEAIKGLTAYCGRTDLDAKLLEQIRYLLAGNRAPTATGGYQDQKQLGAALMFLLGKKTSRIWSQLTTSEKSKIDAIMEAHLYSSAFTTKDTVARNLGIDGDTNLHRDWNPNYQNGMVGMMIVTSTYFGTSTANTMLANFSFQNFVNKLTSLGLTNLLTTYQMNRTNPTPATVQADIRKDLGGGVRWAFYGRKLDQPRELFRYIATRTFNKRVRCGLNDGNGVTNGGIYYDAGRIVNKANCSKVPNYDRLGMMLEFDATDANGLRSAAYYTWDGWFTLSYVRVALQAFWGLNAASVTSDVATPFSSNGTINVDGKTPSFLPNLPELFTRYSVGTRDWYWKAKPVSTDGGGYRNFAKGKFDSTTYYDSAYISKYGGEVNKDIYNMLQRHLALPTF